MNKKTIIKLLKIILEKRCPERFSLSGPEAERNDFFSLHIYKDEEPYLLLQNIVGDTIECLEWNGEKFNNSVKIKLDDIDLNTLDITHYYKTSIIEFDSLSDFRRQRIIRTIYIESYLKNLKSKISQYIFNKKELINPERMKILKKMIDLDIEKPNLRISTISLMSKLYSKKWILHPQHQILIYKMELYLNSLVHSKDLFNDGSKYSLSPKAIVTYNEYKEIERQYRTQARIQIWLVVATVAIAIFTVAQIYFEYFDK